jgi:zinc transporter 2
VPGRSGSFSYGLPTFPRNVSVCQLAGGASEEESIAHKRIQNKLIAALCLAFVFMIIEVVGGIYAHSLAIITDAAHLLSDVSGFAVAVLAAVWAKRRSQEHFSYGYHRVEVLGALASVMTVWLVTGILLFEAVQRIINPEHVDGKIMFIVAMAGVACNVLMMAILGHHHGHGGGSCSHSHGPEHGHSHSRSHSHGNGSHSHAHGKAAKRGAAVQAAAGGAAAAAESLSAAAVDLEAGGGEAAGHGPSGGGCCGHTHGEACSHSHANGAAESHSHGQHSHNHEHGSHSSHSGHSSDEEEHEHQHEGEASGRTPILGAAGHKHGSSCGGHSHGEHGHNHGSSSSSSSSGALAVGHSHAHDHANLNVRGAIIHVIGDFVQSIGVAIAGALIWWHQDDPRWYIADPICTFLFAVLVLWTTRAILRDISDVLMERVPRGLCIKTINDAMSRVAGVEEVHDLHVWSLTPGIPLLCAHINLSVEADPTAVLHELNEYCRSIGIGHSTIQLVVNGCACPCAC